MPSKMPSNEEKSTRGAKEESDQQDEAPADFAAPTEPVELPITDILDLHTFAPKEIPAVVETYLDEAHRKAFTTVRIIHGKGIGVQRERVRAVLSRTSFVARFQDGPGEAGGWGATIVWFKQPSTERGTIIP